MRLLVIDLETTGLDPLQDQILEFGCIAVDMGTKDRTRHEFRRLVMHSRYAGNAVALAMNADILKEIAVAEKVRGSIGDNFTTSEEKWRTETAEIVTLEELTLVFLDWLRRLPLYDSTEKFVLTGKNVGSFDLAFLRMVPGWSEQYRNMKMGHRTIDPGPIYGSLIFDDQPPDLRTCLERAGIEKGVSHRVLEDCRDVLETLEESSQLTTHKKSQGLYEILERGILDTTNATEGRLMTLYRNAEGATFIRETNEFDEKFD